MIHPDALNIMQAMLCLGIAANCFARSAKTCKRTITGIRLSFVWLGVSSVVISLWPWWDYLHARLGLVDCINATPVSLVFEASVFAVQYMTRTHWARGVPERYQRRMADRLAADLHNRRSTDVFTPTRGLAE